MATRKPEESTEQAAVRPRQYAAGTGWDVGQSAPSDAYRSLDDASAPVGPVVYDHRVAGRFRSSSLAASSPRASPAR
jgi:hypothetical protein